MLFLPAYDNMYDDWWRNLPYWFEFESRSSIDNRFYPSLCNYLS